MSLGRGSLSSCAVKISAQMEDGGQIYRLMDDKTVAPALPRTSSQASQ